MNQSRRQSSPVGDIGEKDLGSLIQSFVITVLTNIQNLRSGRNRQRSYISNIQSSKEVLEVMEAIGFGEGKQQVSIDLRLTNGLSGHLQESHEVLVLAGSTRNLNDLLVIARIIGADVGILH